MQAERLRKLVLEFADAASDSVLVTDGEEAAQITPEAMLGMWMERPDCTLHPMFVGWVLGKGVNINSFTPEELELAVQVAYVGDNKNVMFDYTGDLDAESKPQ